MDLPIDLTPEAEQRLRAWLAETEGTVCLFAVRMTIDGTRLPPELFVAGYTDTYEPELQKCERCEIEGRAIYVDRELVQQLSGKQVRVVSRTWDRPVRRRVRGTWTQVFRTRFREALWYE